ncbi:GNAT family N-acetyltransferase [Lacticigenium naphthae]|uniref:GNAT family N-acetyltransferase n=1 Tax=Lacticigenium naphthae TaxID=515351 RepID=UPI00041CE9FE|nr:GNAT family N-acetyltransferase [Lacticigenium naphthae]
MEFKKEGNRFFSEDSDGNLLAEITYFPKGDDRIVIDHTFVDPSLRGQGIAEQSVDYVVKEMKTENKKIEPLCPYVVELFARKPEKYGEISV